MELNSHLLASFIAENMEFANRIKLFDRNWELNTFCDDLEAQALLKAESAID